MRTALFITVLAFLMVGGVIYFNEPAAVAQPIADSIALPDVEGRFDQAIERVENKVAEAEKVKPAAFAAKAKKRIVRKRVDQKESNDVIIVVPADSITYEFPGKRYAGYVVVHPEDFAQVMSGADTCEYFQDTMSQAAVEVANEQIGAWQWVKSLFKKRKHDKE